MTLVKTNNSRTTYEINFAFSIAPIYLFSRASSTCHACGAAGIEKPVAILRRSLPEIIDSHPAYMYISNRRIG